MVGIRSCQVAHTSVTNSQHNAETCTERLSLYWLRQHVTPTDQSWHILWGYGAWWHRSCNVPISVGMWLCTTTLCWKLYLSVSQSSIKRYTFTFHRWSLNDMVSTGAATLRKHHRKPTQQIPTIHICCIQQYPLKSLQYNEQANSSVYIEQMPL